MEKQRKIAGHDPSAVELDDRDERNRKCDGIKVGRNRRHTRVGDFTVAD